MVVGAGVVVVVGAGGRVVEVGAGAVVPACTPEVPLFEGTVVELDVVVVELDVVVELEEVVVLTTGSPVFWTDCGTSTGTFCLCAAGLAEGRPASQRVPNKRATRKTRVRTRRTVETRTERKPPGSSGSISGGAFLRCSAMKRLASSIGPRSGSTDGSVLFPPVGKEPLGMAQLYAMASHLTGGRRLRLECVGR